MHDILSLQFAVTIFRILILISYPTHRAGQEIVCLFMERRGESSLIKFDRFLENPAPRKYEHQLPAQ